MTDLTGLLLKYPKIPGLLLNMLCMGKNIYEVIGIIVSMDQVTALICYTKPKQYALMMAPQITIMLNILTVVK